MNIIKPIIVAPDSSHWAIWIDSALGRSGNQTDAASRFHETLLRAGRVPLLSWHHLEELLCIEDENWARRRIVFIQGLPMVAFLRLPWEHQQIGSIIDILAAEVHAALNGAVDLPSVRDNARHMLLKTGSGRDAIGDEGWVWEVVRPQFIQGRETDKLVMATSRMNLFDSDRTIGEIARGGIREGRELQLQFEKLRDQIQNQITAHGDKRITDFTAMTADFMSRIEHFRPEPGMNVRELIDMTLTSRGIDRDEIRDDSLLSDLEELAHFRAKLRVIADSLDKDFNEIKYVDRQSIPCWQIERSFEQFGQDRQRRAASDLNDRNLATLAPYVDELFVDRRTAEDFKRILHRNEPVSNLICTIRTSANFEGLAIEP